MAQPHHAESIKLKIQKMSRMIAVFLAVVVATSFLGCEHSQPEGVVDAPAAQHFELAKRSRPELIAFLRAMPKGADLHAHLDGSTFSEYVLQSAHEYRRNYDLTTHMFTDGLPDQSVIHAGDLRSSLVELSDFRDHFSLRGWHPGTANGRDHFFSVFQRIASSGRSEQEILAEVLRRNALQNVQHLESIAPVVPGPLRDAVSDRLTAFDIADLESAYQQISDILQDQIFAGTISTRLDEWEQYAEATLNEDNSLPIGSPRPSVRYIPYVFRLGSLRDFFISAAAAMAAVNVDPRVVALTLVGPEDLPDANDLFKPQMKILDFLWRKMGQPSITLHAGELALKDATIFDMHDRIRTSITVGHARRIGHGVSIAWEYDAAGLLAQMAKEKTLVEICLTSNEVILGIAGNEHPFEMYRRAGVPLSLATDDEGISRSPLTMEFVKAVERYDLQYADIKELARNSLEYAFLGGDSLFIDGNFEKLHPEFKGIWRSDWEATESARLLMEESERLSKQVLLERSFVTFEAAFGN
jgi:adenosine deaminase